MKSRFSFLWLLTLMLTSLVGVSQTVFYNGANFTITPTNLLHSNMTAGAGMLITKGTGSKLTLASQVTPATALAMSNSLVALITAGSSAGAIANSNGVGSNTVLRAGSASATNLNLLGAVSQTYISAGHSNQFMSLTVDGSGRPDFQLKDEFGTLTTRLRGGIGDNFFTGMVGFGTASPTAALHVQGSTLLNGSVTIPGGAVSGHVLTSDGSGVATWQVGGVGGSTNAIANNFGKGTNTFFFPPAAGLSNSATFMNVSGGIAGRFMSNGWFIVEKVGVNADGMEGMLPAAGALMVVGTTTLNGTATMHDLNVFTNATVSHLIVTNVGTNRLVGTMPNSSMFTNLPWSPANISSNFVDVFNLSNRLLGVAIPLTSSVIDWRTWPHQYVVIASNTNFTFAGTNDVFGITLTVMTDGLGPYTIGFPFADNTPSGPLPSSVDAPVQFTFWRVNGKMWADYHGQLAITVEGLSDTTFTSLTAGQLLGYNGVTWTNVAAAAGGGATNAIANTNGFGTNLTLYGKGLVNALTTQDFYVNSNGVPHVAFGTFVFDGDGIVSCGDGGLEHLMYFLANSTVTNTVRVLGTLQVDTLTAGPVYATANGKLTNGTTGDLITTAAGVIGFSGRSKITSPSDGELILSNANNSAVANLTAGNISAGAYVTAGKHISSSQGGLISAADGFWWFGNNTLTDWGQLAFGGTNNNFPALGTSGDRLDVELAGTSTPGPLGSGRHIITPRHGDTNDALTLFATNGTTRNVVINSNGMQLLIAGNIAYGQTTKTANDNGTNFVLNFAEGEVAINASANRINITHSTNWPASAVGYCSWDILTGNTNRHLDLPTSLTNHIYGTNSDIPVTTFLLQSNSMYTIPFKSRTGTGAGVYMSYPVKVGP